MEYLPNGNLLSLVSNSAQMPEVIARHYFVQVIVALEYLHNDLHIAHRDLKAENIVLDRYYNIRVVDFGLSHLFTEDDPSLMSSCGSARIHEFF